MAVDEQWLVRGWYEAESQQDWKWHWSTDVASIDPRGVKQIEIKFFTNYSDFTMATQKLTVYVDDEVSFSNNYEAGFHSLTLHCEGARSIVLRVDAVSPAKYNGNVDSRILGIAIYDVTPSTLPENKGQLELSTLNLSPKELPVMMQIEVSTACHLSCVMCSRSAKSGGASEHMKPKIWERFFETARNVEIVNILGTGEPWTHPDFLNYLRRLDDAGVQTAITTNGDLINAERATALGQLRHLRELTFSIDSPDPEVYQKTRGQPLSRTLAALERATAAISNPETIRIHAVVMADTLQSLGGSPPCLAGIRLSSSYCAV